MPKTEVLKAETAMRIVGSFGEGGQMLRSSLSLSLVTENPSGSKTFAQIGKLGLLHRHLTAVQAAKEVDSAEVDGVALGSRELRFGRVFVLPLARRAALLLCFRQYCRL